MKLQQIKTLTEEVHNLKAKQADDWSDDYDPDHGMSYECPNCGSHNVHTVGSPDKRLGPHHAHYLECEDCGHRSKWQGEYAKHHEEKHGDPSRLEHQYHEPKEKK